jgi:glutathione S-transferase
MLLTLYYHPLSSFCHKALIALYENGCEFDKRIIDLGNQADSAELGAIWPFRKFPVLRDHVRNRNVPETTLIIEYLDHFFKCAHPLLPENWDDALQVRHWDRLFDNYVQAPMQKIVSDRISNTQGNLTSERAMLDTAYGMVDRRMLSLTWVAGENFSMADCAAAPMLFYASTVQPFPTEASNLSGYFDRLMQRPSVQRVIEEAKPYFSLYPFADAISKQFR